MATKIILTVEEGLSEQEAQDLRFLLTHAIKSFKSVPSSYITRYANIISGTMVEPFHVGEEDITLLALKLCDAVLSFKVENV